MSAQRTKIVVVGGGYAGVLAANRLRQRPDLDITVVNPRPRFVDRIRLHQLAVGNRDATESGPSPRVLDTLNPGMFLGEAR